MLLLAILGQEHILFCLIVNHYIKTDVIFYLFIFYLNHIVEIWESLQTVNA